MNRKTRYFMLGSFTVLIVGLCAGLVAYYGGLPAGLTAKQAGPAELAYVPPGAVVVAYADIHSVMTSELRRRLKDVMPAGEEKGQEELKNKTGIDLEKDIDHVVACMVPRETSATETENGDSGFVAFRGRFDEGRLEALAREHGAEVGEYKGKRFISIADREKEAEHEGHGIARTMVLAFVEPGLVMFGDRRAVTLAIDAQTSGQNVRSNAELMRHVKDIEGQANAWAVGRFDVLASRANLPEGMSSQIPAIRWFSAAGRVNGGLAGVVRAEARDEEAAKNLRDVANGFLALAKMQAGSRPEFQSAMQSLTLGGTGKTVELSFSVPVELLDAIKAARELKVAP